jgi:glycosyltransferase involved in cell wall biosynthesis
LNLVESKKRYCGVIIPVYNSSEYLDELLKKIGKVQSILSDWQMAVLVVDDGSSPAIVHIDNSSIHYELIRHEVNKGKGAALRTGIHHYLQTIKPDAILTLDGDLQHSPELIPEFLNSIEKNEGDLIIGYRKKILGKMPLHRIISNTLTSRIISILSGQHIRDSQCGYRIFSRRVAENVMIIENRFHFESEMIIRAAWQKFKISYVPIPTIYNNAPSAIKNYSDTLNFISLIFRLILERIRENVREKKK